MRPKLARPSKHADEQYVSLSYIKPHYNLHLIFDVFLISDSATIFVSRRDQHWFRWWHQSDRVGICFCKMSHQWIALVRYVIITKTPRLSGHFSIIGLIFFVLKSLIAREWSRQCEKCAILTVKPWSYVRILWYRTSSFKGTRILATPMKKTLRPLKLFRSYTKSPSYLKVWN